jgi:hypothetical protein
MGIADLTDKQLIYEYVAMQQQEKELYTPLKSFVKVFFVCLALVLSFTGLLIVFS